MKEAAEEVERKAREEALKVQMKAAADQDLSENEGLEDSEEDVGPWLEENVENIKRGRESSSPFGVGISFFSFGGAINCR